MTNLTITSRNQGISYNAAEAAASFAIIEKLAEFAGTMISALRTPVAAPVALRTARA